MSSCPPLRRRPTRLPPLPWLGALLMLCALTVRLAVPAGWMPAGAMPGAGGARLAITICDGTGGQVRTLTLPGDHAPSPRDRQQGEHGACPFAVAALATLAGAAPSLAAPPPPPVAMALAERGTAAPVATHPRRPPGHAPPPLA